MTDYQNIFTQVPRSPDTYDPGVDRSAGED